MSNRKNRRAAAATTEEFPALPDAKNLSGNDQCCGNCPKRANEKNEAWNRHVIHRQPKRPDDEVVCMLSPGGGIVTKRWSWCSCWGEPNTVKVIP